MASEFTTVPLSRPISLQVRLGHGSLEIAARDDPNEATVRLVPRGGGTELLDRFVVELRGETLVVVGPRQGGLADLFRGWRDGWGAVDATIEVPDGTRVTVASATEQMTVTGRCGNTDIATAGGRINLDRIDGDLRLRYGHAECHVGPVTGTVRLKAGSGPTHLAEVGAAFTGQLGRGDLEVAVAHGDVHARTGYGAVHIAAVYGNCDVATGFGPVTIGIPTGVAARVDASTGFGRVISDLPLDQGPARGAPTITVHARTGNGDVSLQRTGAAAA